ncbi:MAG: hypothetical protein PF961_23975 [Planctomycetota bacterium]|jgi:hypothetical protein|nr:hypothetical protein [Planctomycetota bacterium]
MIKHPLIASILGLCAFGGSASAVDAGNDYTVRIIGGAWLTQMGGEFSSSTDLIEGDTFDTDDFGLDDFVASPLIEADVALPLLFELHAGVFSYGADGEATLNELKYYNGTAVLGDTTTDIAVTDLYGEVAWRFLGLDLATASVGLALHYIDTSVDVNSVLGKTSTDEGFPLPAITGRVSTSPWGGWTIDGRLHLMALDVGDVDAKYIDLFAAVNYRFTELFGVQGGYRITQYDIDAEISSDHHAVLDVAFHGPYLGLVLQF